VLHVERVGSFNPYPLLEERAMRVNPRDGVCRMCRGELDIIDADDATLTVECIECGDCYLVETDAFGDGGMTYYVNFMAARLEADDDA
jgi:hypothetical protein